MFEEVTGPLVSIIIVTYNRKEYVLKTINSAFKQSYKNIEVIVVDDGSTDGTKELISAIKKIQYVYQANSERGAARNNGIRCSSGDYIVFLDSDDMLDGEMITNLIKPFQERIETEYSKETGVVYGQIVFITEDEKPSGKRYNNVIEGDVLKEIAEKPLLQVTALIKRECFEVCGGFVEDRALSGSEDYELWFRISQKYSFKYVDKNMLYYRVHSKQTYDNPTKNHENMMMAHELIYSESKVLKEIIHLKNRNLAWLHLFTANNFYLSGKRTEYLIYYLKAVCYYPGIIFKKNPIQFMFRFVIGRKILLILKEKQRKRIKMPNIRKYMPAFINDIGVTIIGTRIYYVRRVGIYNKKKKEYRKLWKMSYVDQCDVQKRKFNEIFHFAKANSKYYAKVFEKINVPILQNLPVLEKEDLRNSIDEIVVGEKCSLCQIYTGGTTGKSLTVYLKASSLQDRFSILDLYMEMHGYRFRSRMAWFSGRSIIFEKDVRKKIFWRTNYYLNIRYYSTFHMNKENLAHYVNNLNEFKPLFITSFPSAIYEVAKFIQNHNVKLMFKPEVIFTTAETLYDYQRLIIQNVFKCKARTQYASSEGAPFILECQKGSLHMEPGSGIIEVVDENNKATQEGEVLVTSFMSRETPLIRYRLGDRLRLSGNVGCECGWETPIVEKIEGRSTDYIDIPGRCKIWAAQFSDCLKGLSSVVNFQVELVERRILKVSMETDSDKFENVEKEVFLKKIKERIGNFPVEIVYVNELSKTSGGKSVLVKR